MYFLFGMPVSGLYDPFGLVNEASKAYLARLWTGKGGRIHTSHQLDGSVDQLVRTTRRRITYRYFNRDLHPCRPKFILR